MRRLLLVLLICGLSSHTLFAEPKAEILWDTYGVPHIFAADMRSLFYAHGWAQMQNHADLLLRLYGESRGRAAEYWGGEDNLELDRWIAVNGVRDRAEDWYRQQDPEFRTCLDAFAHGINDFAKAHPEGVSAKYRVVLPVSGVDVVGHSLRVVHYTYMGSTARMHSEVDQLLPQKASTAPLQESSIGSNTWSIGKPLSASGNPMLLINPHLPWAPSNYTYMEVHLVAPGLDLFGAPQVGFPVPVVGFNPDAGWGRTVDRIDTVDFYRLTVKRDTYQYDGKWLPFEHSTRVVKVRRADGSLSEEKLDVKRSVQGPVVYDMDGLTIAMRVAALDRPKMLEQWFRMGQARNLEQFKTALRMQSVPLWTADYAGADGHIMLVYNGVIPRRKMGDWKFWSGVVPGSTSDTMWTDYLNFDELPKSIDPPSGFNQNTNDQPWLMTLPALDPKKFPPYLSPGPEFLSSFRSLQSLRMLAGAKSISCEQLLADKHNTRMELATAVLPELIALAGKSSDPQLVAAGKVLQGWDGHVDPASRGAVLFEHFADHYFFSGSEADAAVRFRVPYDLAHPLVGPSGLAQPELAMRDLRKAADECQQLYGALDIPWGDVYRFTRGSLDLPGNAGSSRDGVFRSMTYQPGRDNRFVPKEGETFVCAIEFGKQQRAECLLGYGNASQPGSTHISDQLHFMAEKKLLPIWRKRSEIEQHLERREVLLP